MIFVLSLALYVDHLSIIPTERDGYSNILRNHLDLVVEGYLQELPLLVEGESGAAVPLVELSCRGRYLLKSKMFRELHLCN